jgi:hypothetical protein
MDKIDDDEGLEPDTSSDPKTITKLATYRKQHGLCYLCGRQGILICCDRIRCGAHASEHLHKAARRPRRYF